MASNPKVGIIGRGNAGSAIKNGLDKAGYEVRIVGSDPRAAKETASWSDVLILAVPFSVIDQTLSEIGNESLNGKVVVDVTNNFNPRAKEPSMGGSEELQRKIPTAKVVKSFNHIFAANMDSGHVKAGQLTLFVAGDDKDAKSIVLKLGKDIGFDPIDAGSLINGRVLDGMAQLIIQLAFQSGMGVQTGYKLLH